jgi:capsular exopolysaccharide synthesis family protein
MKPGQLAGAVKKRYWILIIFVVVAALAATLVGRVQSPVYKVEISMAAVPPINPVTKQPDATITLAYQSVIPTIANACENIQIARAVHTRLLKENIDLAPEVLLNKVSTGPVAQTNSLRIDVTDGQPQRVAEIANAWGVVCSEQLSGTLVMLNGTLAFIKQAIPPSKPTQPKPMLYLGLGVFLGLVLGFSLVIGIEYFDPHFRSAEEAEEMLGLPVLGMLPKKAKNDGVRGAYSDLRTTLLFSLAERDASSVVVTPAVSVRGMHEVSMNLAKSISDTGRKTLLVDCDMRQRAVSGMMAASDLPGLSESLEEGGSVKGRIAMTTFPNLFLLPAGKTPTSPPDLLSQPDFKAMLGQLEGQFEKVVLDAPALATAVDGAVVAANAGASIVVIDVKSCTRNTALLALEAFHRLQLKPSGIVLANIKARRIGRRRAK